MTNIDITIKLFTVAFLLYVGYSTTQAYNRVYSLKTIPHGMVDVLERSIYMSFFLVFTNLALILSHFVGNAEYTQHIYTINHISLLVGAFLFYEANNNRLASNKKIIEKEIAIKKITAEAVATFDADRVAMIEYNDHHRYASLRYTSYRAEQYNIDNHWQNMPMDSIHKFADVCRDRGLFEAPDTANYHDKEASKIMQGYRHKSLYMKGLQVDGVDVGYLAIMYVETKTELSKEKKEMLSQYALQVEDILRKY
jgi:hypothetical protein